MARTRAAWIVTCGIALILLAMLVGPFYAPAEFSWVRHSTSEQAGQHLRGAWIMRAGFVAYGLGVAGAAVLDWRTRPWVRAALFVFGLGMIGTAVWSNAPILPDLPADLAQDRLHSAMSGLVGTAFAAACAARLFAPGGDRADIMAWAGLAISVLIPLAMAGFPDIRGALQRGMFVFSFIFVLREFA